MLHSTRLVVCWLLLKLVDMLVCSNYSALIASCKPNIPYVYQDNSIKDSTETTFTLACLYEASLPQQ